MLQTEYQVVEIHAVGQPLEFIEHPFPFMLL
jgi:hypothetical protein